MKKVYLLIITIALLTSCVSTNKTSNVALKKINFNYDPPHIAASGSADMNIILVNPSFAKGFEYSGREPYVTFAKNMRDDFEELLIARGFIVQGPYPSYDELVFSVKEKGDLILETAIDVTQQENNFKYLRNASLLEIFVGTNPEKWYTIKGSVILSGKITIKALEPQTREKLWVKSVPIQQETVQINSSKSWSTSQINRKEMYGDTNIRNAIASALSKIYTNTLSQTNTYIDPRELQLLKPQIKRIKEGVRY